MRQMRQALRLHLEAGLSYAQVARAAGIGKGTVGKLMLLARAAGVDWSVAQTLSDEQLEERLCRPAVPRSSRCAMNAEEPWKASCSARRGAARGHPGTAPRGTDVTVTAPARSTDRNEARARRDWMALRGDAVEGDA